MASFVHIVLLVLASGCLGRSEPDSKMISPEFRNVTCQSSVKVMNPASGYYLYSDAIMYGSGSKQQFVSGVTGADEANSYFVWEQGVTEPYCPRGSPVACDGVIRLLHAPTKKYVTSSSNHASPLSSQQEVCCALEAMDEDDARLADWKVICIDKKASNLARNETFRLKHVISGAFLTVNPERKFSNPIAGHVEVTCSKKESDKNLWVAKEGIYFPANVARDL